MNQAISDLIARGFGGGEAVVVPGAESADNLPSSSPPAGVSFAIEEFVKAASDDQGDGGNCWVVLIGGPGNGKSFQVERVIRKLGLEPMHDDEGLARRSSWTNTGHSKVLVVNDATIRDSDSHAGAGGDLSKEFQMLFTSSKQGPTHALISVNRGILIEEKAQAADQQAFRAEHRILSWLMGHDEDAEHIGSNGASSGYYRSIEFSRNESTPVVRIHAVYLDQLSLLEVQPKLDESNCDAPPQYVTMRPKRDTRDETPAANLLKKLCAHEYFEETACGSCPVQGSCPMYANVQALRAQQVRLGFLDVVRYAEVVSGHLFTYRDLWALFAVAIAGSPESDVGEKHRCDWIKGLVAALDENGEASESAAYALSRQRFYDALFEGVSPLQDHSENDRTVETSPALRRLSRVDPVIDANRAWAEPVLESVQSIAYGESPLESAANRSEPFSKGVAEIDLKIESKLLSRISGDQERADDIARRAILRWRGHTLFRHFAICNGFAAHYDVAEEWLKLRMHVTDNPSEFPSDSPVNFALKYMLLPKAKFSGNDLCLLPLFEPRVLPITGPQEAPVWCYGVPLEHEVKWSIRTVGDAMEVTLDRISGGRIARFELDFNICREALACTVFGGSRNLCDYGFTEQGDAVSPRLERIRASFLSSIERDESALAQIAHTGVRTVRLEAVVGLSDNNEI